MNYVRNRGIAYTKGTKRDLNLLQAFWLRKRSFLIKCSLEVAPISQIYIVPIHRIYKKGKQYIKHRLSISNASSKI